MRLTENFTLDEMCRSNVAIRRGINNVPSPEVIKNLDALCENVLQPLRTMIDSSIIVSSGYRSPELNNAIGGSPTSDHMYGNASDIETHAMSNYELAEFIRINIESFDQLILEYPSAYDPRAGWVHVSYRSEGNRNELLTAQKVNGSTVYKSGIIKP